MSEPRAFTKEEMRARVLEHLAMVAHYWATIPNPSPNGTVLDRCNGVVFSVLTMLDGVSSDLPGINLVMQPHMSDKASCIENGENWTEMDQVINDDVSLHDVWNRYAATKP